MRNGHDVLVIGPPTLDAKGLPFRAGDAPPDETIGPIWATMPSQPPGQGDVIVVGTIFAQLNVEAMLPAMRATIEEWQPDLVLREFSEYASAIAADELGVRHARVACGLFSFEEFALGVAGGALDDARPGIVERIVASPILSALPESVDPAHQQVLRFRESVAERTPEPIADWWPGDDRPLVYMTFGSVAASVPMAAAAYPVALHSIASLDARVLLSTGQGIDDLVAPSPNVHVERWVSNEPDVITEAAVVVSHGGFGTTLAVLASGTPLVFVPLFADQPFNAARVALAGSGVVSTPAASGQAVQRLLADDRYAARAVEIADEMRRYPPIDDVLAGLE